MARRSSRPLGAINWKSPWVWGPALAAVGLILFWPKKAKASTKAAPAKALPEPNTPVGSETGATGTGGTAAVVRDPGSGVLITGPTGSIQPATTYTVGKGESWSNIASRTYGDYRWWPALWNANRTATAFTNPALLRVGDTVSVPSLPLTDTAYKAAIFKVAEADRSWELAKKRGTAARVRPAVAMSIPAIPVKVAEAGTPVSASTNTAASAPQDELEIMSADLSSQLDARKG